MKVLNFIFEYWLMLLFPAIILGGIIVRFVTHQPFTGDITPVGVFQDLPESVTGMKKPENDKNDIGRIGESTEIWTHEDVNRQEENPCLPH